MIIIINNIDISQIEVALKKVKPGIEKYMRIQEKLRVVNVKEDMEFRRLYNGFYKVMRRKADFYELHYSYLEEYKNSVISFEEAIKYFYEKTGRVEASFASKIVANINPKLPIWDTFVLSNLGIDKPKQYKKPEVRIKESINMYKILKKKYGEFLLTDEAKVLIEMFDKEYPDTRISDVKKIDFILWQIR